MKANGPIVVLALNRVLQGSPLGMALNASIVCTYKIQLRWIDDIRFVRIRGVLASRAVAALTADIPLRHRFFRDVVVHGMTAITKRTGGTFCIVCRVERHPPISIRLYEIGAP